MLVALEILLLPVWVGLVFGRSGWRLSSRLISAPAAVVLLSGVLLVMASLVGGPTAAGVLRAQAVAMGFVALLGGIGTVGDRLIGPRATQMLVVLLGWIVVGSVVLVGPLVSLLDGQVQALGVRAAVYGNPLVVAEQELGLAWLRQDLTYRLSVLGESYSYLAPDIAWYKTLLGHLFVGSALVVFSVGRRAPKKPAD